MGEGTDEVRDRSPDEIRNDIEATRSEMGETIDAIQDRVDPEQVKESVRRETIGRAREVADQTSARVKATSSRLVERAQPALEEARKQAGPYAEQAQENLQRGRTRLQRMQEENPAMLYGVVAGVVAAMLLLIWLLSRGD